MLFLSGVAALLWFHVWTALRRRAAGGGGSAVPGRPAAGATNVLGHQGAQRPMWQVADGRVRSGSAVVQVHSGSAVVGAHSGSTVVTVYSGSAVVGVRSESHTDFLCKCLPTYLSTSGAHTFVWPSASGHQRHEHALRCPVCRSRGKSCMTWRGRAWAGGRELDVQDLPLFCACCVYGLRKSTNLRLAYRLCQSGCGWTLSRPAAPAKIQLTNVPHGGAQGASRRAHLEVCSLARCVVPARRAL
eukprot:365861-Chlamydomonas_euryale.AAC.8